MHPTHVSDPNVDPERFFEGLREPDAHWPHPAILAYRHNLSYYEAMPMTSLNISLPEALKEYVEGQVATGDWGTPSEYVRELIRQDKERRLEISNKSSSLPPRDRKSRSPWPKFAARA